MVKLRKFLHDLWSPPRWPARYDPAPGHVVLSADSAHMIYWVDDTRSRARAAARK